MPDISASVVPAATQTAFNPSRKSRNSAGLIECACNAFAYARRNCTGSFSSKAPSRRPTSVSLDVSGHCPGTCWRRSPRPRPRPQRSCCLSFRPPQSRCRSFPFPLLFSLSADIIGTPTTRPSRGANLTSPSASCCVNASACPISTPMRSTSLAAAVVVRLTGTFSLPLTYCTGTRLSP
jgi:hypothetical protein